MALAASALLGCASDASRSKQTAYASPSAQSGGFAISPANLLITGRPLADAVAGDRAAWSAGAPAD